jgi:5-(carboxyamino)imidazole ribonucleotide mutase
MHSIAVTPFTSSCPVILVAFGGAGLEPLSLTAEVLRGFEVEAEQTVLRVPPGEIPDFTEFAPQAIRAGIRLVIAASHEIRPVRALAAAVTMPVIRVPVAIDASPAAALAALTQDANGAGAELAGPRGGSFATVALGEAGARNAALLAVSILALTDARLSAAWQAFRDEQTNAVLLQPPPAG